MHVRHVWPLPGNLGPLLKGFDKVLVPEMNTGQFKTVLRDQFLVDAQPLTKTSGQPFAIAEIEDAICDALGEPRPSQIGGEVEVNDTQLPTPESVEH